MTEQSMVLDMQAGSAERLRELRAFPAWLVKNHRALPVSPGIFGLFAAKFAWFAGAGRVIVGDPAC